MFQLNPELSNTHIMSLCNDLGFPSVAWDLQGVPYQTVC